MVEKNSFYCRNDTIEMEPGEDITTLFIHGIVQSSECTAGFSLQIISYLPSNLLVTVDSQYKNQK